MVFFIYQLGSLASVWAISNLIKKDVPQRIKNKIIVLLLVTSWIGVLGYFFILKNRIEKCFYGEIELEEFELNIIVHFIVLLYQNQKGLKWYNKLKRRYTILSRKDIYLKLIRSNEGD